MTDLLYITKKEKSYTFAFIFIILFFNYFLNFEYI